MNYIHIEKEENSRMYAMIKLKSFKKFSLHLKMTWKVNVLC